MRGRVSDFVVRSNIPSKVKVCLYHREVLWARARVSTLTSSMMNDCHVIRLNLQACHKYFLETSYKCLSTVKTSKRKNNNSYHINYPALSHTEFGYLSVCS